jgi:branched-chain amino acid transport system permease protein
MVIRVNTIEKTVVWHWERMGYVAAAVFFGSFIWRWLLARKELKKDDSRGETKVESWLTRLQSIPALKYSALALLAAVAVAYPQVMDLYQTNIMISCLVYVVLGLGLNIVVGLAGLLDLGYVAFYAVGAYAYALCNMHWDIGFWYMLPVGAVLGIARPSLFGIKFGVIASTQYMFYIMVGLVVFTIFCVNRLQNSRIGRAWLALREDEIACQAMGIDKMKTKLMAFALGATWAGMAGVVFAAKTTFINPASFTFWESAIILSIVVIGGMGSIRGVIAGAIILILVPEFLRDFAEFRMLLFGAIMVLVMVFRPQGLISAKRKIYEYKATNAAGAANE